MLRLSKLPLNKLGIQCIREVMHYPCAESYRNFRVEEKTQPGRLNLALFALI